MANNGEGLRHTKEEELKRGAALEAAIEEYGPGVANFVDTETACTAQCDEVTDLLIEYRELRDENESRPDHAVAVHIPPLI
jgi:hypothetical protein